MEQSSSDHEDGTGGTFEVDPDVVAQTMGEQLVLVHLRTNRIHSLNATALRLWELLAEGLTREAIARQLLSEFDVEADTLNAEIDSTLTELSGAGLIIPSRDD